MAANVMEIYGSKVFTQIPEQLDELLILAHPDIIAYTE